MKRMSNQEVACIVDDVGKRMKAKYGQRIPTDCIEREVERAGGGEKGFVLPTDYCYNRINAGGGPLPPEGQTRGVFQYHLFRWLGSGLCEYVGPGHAYADLPIMWPPRFAKKYDVPGGLELPVGSWDNGRCTLHFDPRKYKVAERADFVKGWAVWCAHHNVDPRTATTQHLKQYASAWPPAGNSNWS